MSIEALQWAKRQQVGCSGRKAILMAIADRADEQWSCFPSAALLAAETELSERSVFRHLAKLEAEEWIHVERRPGRRLRFTLRPGVAAINYRETRTTVTPDSLAPLTDCQPVTPDSSSRQTRTTVTPDSLAPLTKTTIPPHPPIKINPQGKTKSSEAYASSLLSELEPELPMTRVTGEPGSPVTDDPSKARHKQKKLAAFGDDEGLKALWNTATLRMKARSSAPEVVKALKSSPYRLDEIALALSRYVAHDADVLADRGQPGLHTWIATGRAEFWLGEDWKAAHDPSAQLLDDIFAAALERAGGGHESPGDPSRPGVRG